MALVPRNRRLLLEESMVGSDAGRHASIYVSRQDVESVRASSYPLAVAHTALPSDGSPPLLPVSRGHHEAQRAPQKPPRHRLAASCAVTYVLVTFLLTIAGSGWLYVWANNQVLDSWPLAPVGEEATQIVAGQEGQTSAVVVAEPATGDGSAPANAAASPLAIPRLNVLLLGTDARPDDTDAARTDTMILLSLDPQKKAAGLLSLPRDLWVPIAGQGYSDKINMAYVHGETDGYEGGGAQLTKDTVSSFIGQPINYYVRVNFHGFVKLVDLIGGIDITVPNTIHDEEYPDNNYGYETFHLDAGLQHLDGATALKYVRTRHTDDDYSRARRQQQVIRAIVDKVMRADMIPTLMPRALQLLGIMRSSIDTDIAISTQIELANYLRTVSMDEFAFRQEVLDNRYGEETFSEYGHWILKPDREKVRSAMRRFFEQDVTAEDGGAVALADASWVRVEVLNGTGQPGIAARTRDLLQAQGWQVVSIGDADRSNYDRTIVVNYGHVSQTLVTQMSSDLHLQTTLPTLELTRLASNSIAPVDVRIVLGSDILPSIR